jgi:hypothetical protein
LIVNVDIPLHSESLMENEHDVDIQESYLSRSGPLTAGRLSGVRRKA